MKHSSYYMMGLALGASALLSACGGGGGSAAAIPMVVVGSDVPVTATQSSQGAIDFVRTVVADDNENGDGIRIDAADLSTSETDESDPDI